jgi:hypothetical protein
MWTLYIMYKFISPKNLQMLKNPIIIFWFVSIMFTLHRYAFILTCAKSIYWVMVNVLIGCDILAYNFSNSINDNFPMTSIYVFIYWQTLNCVFNLFQPQQSNERFEPL